MKTKQFFTELEIPAEKAKICVEKDKESERSFSIVKKSSGEGNLELNGKKYDVEQFDLHENTKEDISKWCNSVNTFSNQCLFSSDKRYLVSLHYDKNLLPKKYAQYLEQQIEKVKKSFPNGSQVEFITVNQRQLRSNPEVVELRAIDMDKYKEKQRFFFESKNLGDFEEYLSRERDYIQQLSPYHIYKGSFDAESLTEFCESLLKGELEYQHISQNPFPI